jgi:hypothetical protein
MNRREAISRTALLFGGTIIGAEAFLSGCGPKKSEAVLSGLDFSPTNVAFLDEVGETILPTTASSPGAKAAQIGEFMKVIVTDCYEEGDQKVFMEGFAKINEAADTKFGMEFMDLSAENKLTLLNEIDKEAKTYSDAKKEGDPNHYFSLMKQLTLWGYFTSEVGSTKALRYLPVPGKYEGCIPYQKGDKLWAAI